MRIVLDTNIYVAASLGEGLAKDILRVITKKSLLTAVTSEEILTELQEKLHGKFHWSRVDTDDLLMELRKTTVVVVIEEKVSVVERDPDDDKILECAVAGRADLIVSADQDLIKLKNFRGIAIIHPRTFSWTFPEHFKGKNSN